MYRRPLIRVSAGQLLLSAGAVKLWTTSLPLQQRSLDYNAVLTKLANSGLCKVSPPFSVMPITDTSVHGAAVTGVVVVAQILAMGYFAGDQRGLNLAVEAVSYNAYSFKGLVRNELQQGHIWGCPQQQFPAVAQVCCALPCPVTNAGQTLGCPVRQHFPLLYNAYVSQCSATDHFSQGSYY